MTPNTTRRPVLHTFWDSEIAQYKNHARVSIARYPQVDMRRRRLLGVLPAALISGCAAPRFLSSPLQSRSKPLVLAPVAVSADRIIRRVVGHRPYRPSGFNVSAQTLGDKTLVHNYNYGHGGSGVTLSWGTAALALAQPRPDLSNVVVLGCGAVGLATARLLQERRLKVTIYAKTLPPHTTSNVAAAQWWPSVLYEPDRLTPPFRTQLVRAAHFAYARFQSMVGEGERYGVRWARNYDLSDTPFSEPSPEDTRAILADLQPEAYVLHPGEHPFEAAYVRQWDSLMIDSPRYLSALLHDFLIVGGKIVVKELTSIQEVA